jgi:hypothetical protein
LAVRDDLAKSFLVGSVNIAGTQRALHQLYVNLGVITSEHLPSKRAVESAQPIDLRLASDVLSSQGVLPRGSMVHMDFYHPSQEVVCTALGDASCSVDEHTLLEPNEHRADGSGLPDDAYRMQRLSRNRMGVWKNIAGTIVAEEPRILRVRTAGATVEHTVKEVG